MIFWASIFWGWSPF